MQYEDLLSHITPAIYERLKQAVELGKWPDGKLLTPEQKRSSMSAVLDYQRLHLPENQHAGFIEKSCASKTQNTTKPTVEKTLEQTLKLPT